MSSHKTERMMADEPTSAPPSVEVRTRTTIGGHRFEASLVIQGDLWQDPMIQDRVRAELTHMLTSRILDEFPPEMEARVINDDFTWGAGA